MNIFKTNQIINRLNQMIDNAIEGRPIENGFDESKMSALETKLSRFLAANSATKTQLAEEKTKINELISDISHQTKTPLSNILLYTQLLSERDLPMQDRDLVTALIEQAEKLNFLVSSLVKTSRLETGVISVTPKSSAIQGLIDDVAAQAQPKAADKQIHLITASTSIMANFDPKWTGEALYNIIDNAIKYTPYGGNVTISATAYQLFCRIDIIDTGMGITEEEVPKVFSRFYRSPCVSDREGVGIGLYLARKIISAQSGYIKVKSLPGTGSTFSVFLPISE